MSENNPIYNTTPAPALLTAHDLATLADTLAGERQSCADEPATPLGYWPTAVSALLSHVQVLADRVKRQQAELSEQEVEKMHLIRELLTAQRGSTTEMLTPALLASRFGLLAEERDGDVYLLPTYQSESLSKKADTARAKAKAILTGADPSPANAALIQPR